MVHKPSRNGPWQAQSSSSGTSCSEHFIARGLTLAALLTWAASPALISAWYPLSRAILCLIPAWASSPGNSSSLLGFVVLGSAVKRPRGGAGGGWSSLRAASEKGGKQGHGNKFPNIIGHSLPFPNIDHPLFRGAGSAAPLCSNPLGRFGASGLISALCWDSVRGHWGRIKSFFVVLLHGFWHWENL